MAVYLKRILVVGGYGGFGARLTRRLVERGYQVLVLGRDGGKARAFCATVRHTSPVIGDRQQSLAPILEQHRPNLVIDAAGPFQNCDYRLPRECIDLRIPYLDLADARDFVVGIDTLDREAKAAGVPIISGASSVPALSGAVVRHLAKGLDHVQDVEIAISASARGTGGAAVIGAILSYVGRPVPLWRGGRWTTAAGWSELRRQDFEIAGIPPIRKRWVALADVPDHVILPKMLVGSPQVSFRAGTELAHQTIGLSLIGRMVRCLRLQSALSLRGALVRLQNATRAFGSERSAMSVQLRGLLGRACVERKWTLIADSGHGPEIPTLAAPIIADLIAAGSLAPEARSAAGILQLAQFEPLFSSLQIRQEVNEVSLPAPLYQRVMGEAFDGLPPAVRQMHRLCADSGARGAANVERGCNPLAKLIAWIMRFPPAGHHPLHVAFEVRSGVETWTRSFGGYRFKSELQQRGSHLIERFGPMRFHFDLQSKDDGLFMRLRGWTCLDCGCRLRWDPKAMPANGRKTAAFASTCRSLCRPSG